MAAPFDDFIHDRIYNNLYLEATLDKLADAILWRRQGYVFKWEAVAREQLGPSKRH